MWNQFMAEDFSIELVDDLPSLVLRPGLLPIVVVADITLKLLFVVSLGV